MEDTKKWLEVTGKLFFYIFVWWWSIGLYYLLKLINCLVVHREYHKGMSTCRECLKCGRLWDNYHFATSWKERSWLWK